MNNIFEQAGRYIDTLHPEAIAKAIIFSEEQRQKIRELLRMGYFPKLTSVGKGLSTRKHWNVIDYKGRYGEGYKMITSSPYSHNFNHITYFVRMI